VSAPPTRRFTSPPQLARRPAASRAATTFAPTAAAASAPPSDPIGPVRLADVVGDSVDRVVAREHAPAGEPVDVATQFVIDHAAFGKDGRARRRRGGSA
jgi:hypothetical protein